MDENQSLGIEISAEVTKALGDIQELIDELEKLKTKIVSTKDAIKDMSDAIKSLGNASTFPKTISNNLNKTGNDIDKFTNKILKANEATKNLKDSLASLSSGEPLKQESNSGSTTKVTKKTAKSKDNTRRRKAAATSDTQEVSNVYTGVITDTENLNSVTGLLLDNLNQVANKMKDIKSSLNWGNDISKIVQQISNAEDKVEKINAAKNKQSNENELNEAKKSTETEKQNTEKRKQLVLYEEAKRIFEIQKQIQKNAKTTFLLNQATLEKQLQTVKKISEQQRLTKSRANVAEKTEDIQVEQAQAKLDNTKSNIAYRSLKSAKLMKENPEIYKDYNSEDYLEKVKVPYTILQPETTSTLKMIEKHMQKIFSLQGDIKDASQSTVVFDQAKLAAQVQTTKNLYQIYRKIRVAANVAEKTEKAQIEKPYADLNLTKAQTKTEETRQAKNKADTNRIKETQHKIKVQSDTTEVLSSSKLAMQEQKTKNLLAMQNQIKSNSNVAEQTESVRIDQASARLANTQASAALKNQKISQIEQQTNGELEYVTDKYLLKSEIETSTKLPQVSKEIEEIKEKMEDVLKIQGEITTKADGTVVFNRLEIAKQEQILDNMYQKYRTLVSEANVLERTEEIRVQQAQATLDDTRAEVALKNQKVAYNEEYQPLKLQEENKKIETYNKRLEQMDYRFTNMKKSATGLKGVISKLWETGKIIAVYRMYKNIINVIKNFFKYSIDYVETLNLFQKSMGTYTSTATKFVNEMAEAFGIARETIMNYQSTYNNIMSSIGGITEETAYNISETLTEMAADYSSLYNFSLESAMTKIQSALVGNTKPIRDKSGVDVTRSTLQTIATSLGIEKSVTSLTEIEKRLLRIIAIQRQMKEAGAMGDYADTIETASNQIKVLQSQLKELSTWIGNIFLGSIKAVLPYVNALVMVIKELVKAFAYLVGYTEETGSGLTDPISSDDTMASLYGVTDAADDASDALDNYNKKLQGFDVLNNITSDTDTSSSTSSGTTVDPRILSALGSYDSLLTSVNMKATGIRNKILEWLGFTVETDEATGDISLKFDHITGGTVLGALVVGGAIFLGIKKIVDLFKTLFGITSKLKSFATAKTVSTALTTTASGAATAVSTATGVVNSSSEATKGFKLPSFGSIVKGLAEVALIVGGLIALIEVLGLLMKIPGVQETAQQGIELLKTVFNGLLSVIVPIALFGAAVVVLGKIQISEVATGLANAAIILAGISALVIALGALYSIPEFASFTSAGIELITNVFNGLTAIMLPLVEMSAYIVIIGLIPVSDVALGLANFAIIVAGISAVIIALGAIVSIPYFSEFASSGIDLITNVFNGLNQIITPLGVLSALIVVLGFASPAIVLSGLAGFALVIGGLTAVIVALGALTHVDGFNELMSDGGQVLMNLGYILGGFAGSVVAGFADLATSSLGEVGTHLSEFAENAQPFFEMTANLNESAMNGVKALAGAILELTATNVITGIISFLTGGATGKKLDLVGFGKEIAEFAPYLKTYSDKITGIDGNLIQTSATAAKSLSELANGLPNSGGVLGDWIGNNDLDDFAKQLPVFGENLKKYADNVSGLDADVVTNSVNSAQALSELANNLPNEGGVASWFTGDNKISTFGAEVAVFGEKLKIYNDYVNSISIDKINQATDAVGSLVQQLLTIKNNSLTNTAKDFGNALSSFSSQITEYFNNTFNNNSAYSLGWNFGYNIGVGIANGIKYKTLPSFKLTSTSTGEVLGTFKMSAYANGGFPDVGELFLSREAGPEFVGRMGNKNVVANNDQIVEAVAKGVAEAVSSTIGNSSTNVYLDSRQIAKAITNRQNKTLSRVGA